jgi:hypothetical protein
MLCAPPGQPMGWSVTATASSMWMKEVIAGVARSNPAVAAFAMLDLDDPDHRGSLLRRAGCRVRLLRCPRTQRAARHRIDVVVSAGGPRPTVTQGSTGSPKGADISVSVRMDPAVKAAITTIPDDDWTTIEYTDAIRDETTDQ